MVNAYAAPRVSVEVHERVFGESDGERVGLARAGTPPLVCAKCGTHDGVVASRRLFASGRIALAIVAGAAIRVALWLWWPMGQRMPLTPVAFLTAFFLTLQWARVAVPLCDWCGRRWRMGAIADYFAPGFMWVAAFGFEYAVASATSSVGLVLQSLLYLGAIVILFGAARTFSRPRVLRAHDMDTDRVWVTGLHPDAETAYCAGERAA